MMWKLLNRWFGWEYIGCLMEDNRYFTVRMRQVCKTRDGNIHYIGKVKNRYYGKSSIYLDKQGFKTDAGVARAWTLSRGIQVALFDGPETIAATGENVIPFPKQR